LKVQLRDPRTLANWVIYSSVVLGVALLVQLYSIVPSWLFYSLLIGWTAYFVVGIAVAMRKTVAYLLSLVLAALTLAVSLPQPDHYSFGSSVASVTFIPGSVLQIGVIVSVTRHLLLRRRGFRETSVLIFRNDVALLLVFPSGSTFGRLENLGSGTLDAMTEV
jgi:hypothetical protein